MQVLRAQVHHDRLAAVDAMRVLAGSDAEAKGYERAQEKAMSLLEARARHIRGQRVSDRLDQLVIGIGSRRGSTCAPPRDGGLRDLDEDECFLVGARTARLINVQMGGHRPFYTVDVEWNRRGPVIRLHQWSMP